MNPARFFYLRMVCVLIFLSLSGLSHAFPRHNNVQSDSLPTVLAPHRGDLVGDKLRSEAKVKFAVHSLSSSLEAWETEREELREKIIKKAGIEINPELPLDMKVTRSIQRDGYTINNISFQTLPGIYATANLFVPEGEGPFPAAIVMMGHSRNGRLYDVYQSLSHLLALNGYVSLSMDPWGAGERSTEHGVFEYHGGNLGASLMNIGQSLLGIQVTDNMRGVDLLSSLPYVDSDKIGATGTSGGGNQTMWLAAMDSRIKAAVPVTSVGTFESYVMAHNCVCEVLVDGLDFMEESGILAMVAPNALALYNGTKESNPAFFPSEMLRSYENAREIYELYGAADKIQTLVLDLPHGYTPPMREAMLGWFNLHLKGEGDGSPVKDLPFELASEDDLMTFSRGNRAAEGIFSTEAYCKQVGNDLRTDYLANTRFDPVQERNELKELLGIEQVSLEEVHGYAPKDGWERRALELSDGRLIPLLLKFPKNSRKDFTIVFDPLGKSAISDGIIADLKKKGSGIVLADLSGTGETSSEADNKQTISKFHSIARAEIWLGRTLLGKWAEELGFISQFLSDQYNAGTVHIDASKEGGLAAIFFAALEPGKEGEVVARDSPLSYLFDSADGVDYYNMSVHIPGILEWGDVSLASALAGNRITFINPKTMSGKEVGNNLQQYKSEFSAVRSKANRPGEAVFIQE